MALLRPLNHRFDPDELAVFVFYIYSVETAAHGMVILWLLDHQHIDDARANPDWAAEATILLSFNGQLILRDTLRQTLETAHLPGKPNGDLHLTDKNAICEHSNGTIVYHTSTWTPERALKTFRKVRTLRRIRSPKPQLISTI